MKNQGFGVFWKILQIFPEQEKARCGRQFLNGVRICVLYNSNPFILAVLLGILETVGQNSGLIRDTHSS